MVLLLAGVQACATRPSGVLVPIIAPSDATPVNMLVFSNRMPTVEIGVVFSGKRADDASILAATVTIPPDHEVGVIEWPRQRQADPRQEFATTCLQPLTNESEADAWIGAHTTDGRLLIFVHGFNVPFDRALYLLAQLTHDSGIGATPVLFAWPSRGTVWGYVYDRESANFSRDALETVLRLAARNPEVREITVLAHSMGSWIAVEALRQYAIREGRVDPKIENVILAAPDLDADVFRQQLASLGRERPHFTFLVSQEDQALRLSRLLAGGVNRVGAMDPSREPYRSALQRAEGITVIDLTKVRGRDRLNHSLFASSPEVVRLLGTSIVSGPGLSAGPDEPLGALVLDIVEGVVVDLSRLAPASDAASPRRLEGDAEPHAGPASDADIRRLKGF